MKKILVIAAIVLIAVGCNKNQRAVNKLDGTWRATKFVTTDSTGKPIDLIALGGITSFTMSFDKCKLKDNDYCTMRTSLTILLIDPIKDTSLFIVSNDGLTLEAQDDLSSTTVVRTDIIELTKTTLKTKIVNSDGIITEVKLEKQ